MRGRGGTVRIVALWSIVRGRAVLGRIHNDTIIGKEDGLCEHFNLCLFTHCPGQCRPRQPLIATKFDEALIDRAARTASVCRIIAGMIRPLGGERQGGDVVNAVIGGQRAQIKAAAVQLHGFHENQF